MKTTELFWLAAFVAVFLYAIFRWQNFKTILYQLMLTAKSMAKDMILNSGAEQEAWVLEKAYLLMPRWVAALMPREMTLEIIRRLYHAVKDYADDGCINNSL